MNTRGSNNYRESVIWVVWVGSKVVIKLTIEEQKVKPQSLYSY